MEYRITLERMEFHALHGCYELKWLQHPHSDAAEYKMWGNGVALPNVFFVLAGIVWSTQFEGQ